IVGLDEPVGSLRAQAVRLPLAGRALWIQIGDGDGNDTRQRAQVLQINLADGAAADDADAEGLAHRAPPARARPAPASAASPSIPAAHSTHRAASVRAGWCARSSALWPRA